MKNNILKILFFGIVSSILAGGTLARSGFSLTGRAALKKLKLKMLKVGPLLVSSFNFIGFFIYTSQRNQLMAFMLPFRFCASGEALNTEPR